MLRKKVVGALLRRVVDGFAQASGGVHLCVRSLLVVATEVFPLLWCVASVNEDQTLKFQVDKELKSFKFWRFTLWEHAMGWV